MNSKVSRLVNWIKEIFDITQEEIDRVLERYYFKQDEEINIIDMAKAFLNEIGIQNYSHNFLEYCLTNKKHKNCAVFNDIERYLGLISGGGSETNILMAQVAIPGKKDLIKKVNIDSRWDELLENCEDLIKSNDVVYEEPENLPNCEGDLKNEVNKAIKLLKYAYSLSEEQVGLLVNFNYCRSDELEECVAGDCNNFTQEIRIKSVSFEPMQTILHEMIHALGIKEEGLTELLAQRISIRYRIIINTIDDEDFDEDPFYYYDSKEDY